MRTYEIIELDDGAPWLTDGIDGMNPAAAFDLLAACEALVSHVESLPDDTEKCRILRLCLNNRAGDLIREAIAKARGETVKGGAQ